MKILNQVFFFDDTEIAKRILIPENLKEMQIGIKGYGIEDTAMIFGFKRSGLLIFNMWSVREPIGIIILNSNYEVTKMKIMSPWIGGCVAWGKYAIEISEKSMKKLKTVRIT